MNSLTIAFAGLTHLGLNSAAAAAEKGFDVICYDQRKDVVDNLLDGNNLIKEIGLDQLLEKNKGSIVFSSDPNDLKKCDLVYISSDVPTDSSGTSDLRSIDIIIENVLEYLAVETVLVILCQVPPGFTRKYFEKHANTYYQVETLIFGRAIERALYPERYIIGCSIPDKKIDSRLSSFLTAYGCPIFPMGFESAELCKTAINLFLAASVSTANTLAEVCENIGADWSEIVPSLRLDKRIGEFSYIETGLGLSGGNIERDLKTVSSLAHEHGAKSSVVDSYIEHSRYRKQWLTRTFFELADDTPDLVVCILGLAYKENTNSVKNSASVQLLNSLPDIRIKVYDPVVKNLDIDRKVEFCSNVYQAAEGCDLLFINTPWDEFNDINAGELINVMRRKKIVDPYRILSELDNNKLVYRSLGKK
jgi:UDPglucose 6-dehydrogenase